MRRAGDGGDKRKRKVRGSEMQLLSSVILLNFVPSKLRERERKKNRKKRRIKIKKNELRVGEESA